MSSTLQRLSIVAALALVVSGTVHLVDAPDTIGLPGQSDEVWLE